jgi:hypothetical protein
MQQKLQTHLRSISLSSNCLKGTSQQGIPVASVSTPNWYADAP